MTDAKIHVRAIDGDRTTDLAVDELIITLPNGIAFSLFPGPPRDEIVALIPIPDEYLDTNRGYARFVLMPGAANQVSITAERLP